MVQETRPRGVYVAYVSPPLSREERRPAKIEIRSHFGTKQQAFLEFVLSHYVSEGVRELDEEKLAPLLRLKYQNSIADAVADLGKADEIAKLFAGFQKYFYQRVVAEAAKRAMRHGWNASDWGYEKFGIAPEKQTAAAAA